ncbi:MAG: alpha/beta fold hydrolase [Actinomyces bowdenii]|nr:alpha/beta fold hydrolase [Actinomyces bowdenii]
MTSPPCTSRPLALTVEGQRLGGLAYIPDDASLSPAPLVICCHGMEGSHTRVAPMARRFAAAGAVAVCLDFRGGGGSASDGDPLAMSVLTELADLEAVLAEACAWTEVDSSRVALFGLSLGGAVAALAAARRPQQISALALWYPALGLARDLRAHFRSLEAVPAEFDYRGSRLGRAYARDAWGLDVDAELSSYRRPVLLVHGDQDRAVPLSVSLRAASALPDAEVVPIPGAAHGFGDANWERAMRATTGFLAWNGILER